MEILEQIAALLERGEDQEVRSLTQSAMDQSLPAPKILEEGLLAGMQVVGNRFRAHDIFLPEVLLAARAMNAGVDILKPHLGKTAAGRWSSARSRETCTTSARTWSASC